MNYEKTCKRWRCIHTHTSSLVNKNVRDDKSFYISQNRRNLKENCKF